MASLTLSKVVEQAKKAAKLEQASSSSVKGRSLCRSEAEALLQSFYPGKLGPKQLRSLVPPAGITCEWLQQLLLDQPLPQGVDVASQAFSVFDPAKSGAADMATLKRFLKQLHSVELSEGELLMLQQAADADMDGAISLEDFRVVFNRQQAAVAAAPAAAASPQLPPHTAECT